MQLKTQQREQRHGNADSKSDQAIIDAAAAQSTADRCETKIDGASVIGTYTAGTETLEISLQLGTTGSGT